MTLWQRQKAGNSSQNIQAQIANFGVNYADARQIAMDVFKQNFAQLSQEAMKVAIWRVEEFTLEYLRVLHRRDPLAINHLQEPGVQYALLSGQSNYARSGDPYIGEVLIDLLAERTAMPQRGTVQLALEEAIMASGRISRDHIKMLSILTLRDRLPKSAAIDFKIFFKHFMDGAAALLDGIHFSAADSRYLAATGCVSLGHLEDDMLETWKQAYPLFFIKGSDNFPEKSLSLSYRRFEKYLILGQVREYMRHFIPDRPQGFGDRLDEIGSEEEFSTLYRLHSMGVDEVHDVAVGLDSRYEDLASKLGEAFPFGVELTTVGIAIGISNLKATVEGDFLDYDNLLI
ncbi:LPO_1073/Vpar_1526 family protein [Streptomyces sp. CG1]|uniref:LPO_1073/Vpar_1526 family protein n=1 Tax=Streptomyces sp. CG1 TaxID=1287523 RepID=UPI0034E20D9B